MAYRRHRSSRRRHYGYSRDIGRERALQHIEEARRLTAELGGTDQDVKAYFFALPPHELNALLAEYGRRHGAVAEDYARQTMDAWRTGARHMSGMVAERLFNLLPPRMPLAAKYRLTESLWQHVGPSSKRTMRIGLDADVEQIVDLARLHIEEIVTKYRIPEQLERRFQWLSAGDVGVKQDLLNHVREMEKSLVVDAARGQMPILLEHLRADKAGYTRRLAQTLRVGKHELELLLDRSATGARIETPMETARAVSAATGSSAGGLWWLWAGIALVVGWLAFG